MFLLKLGTHSPVFVVIQHMCPVPRVPVLRVGEKLEELGPGVAPVFQEPVQVKVIQVFIWFHQ